MVAERGTVKLISNIKKMWGLLLRNIIVLVIIDLDMKAVCADHGRPQGGQNGHFPPPENWD